MKESYINYAGAIPGEESDVMIRLRTLAAEIVKERAYAEYILRQMFPSTATGEYLGLHAAQRGITRRPATKTTGTVTFFPADEDHGTILIPAGTVLCAHTNMCRFVTDSDVTLEEGEDRVRARVTAAQAGARYNVKGGTVTMMVTPIAGIASVSNGTPFSGGADTESDDDLRERVRDSYVHISNGTNASYYKSIAMSVSGVASASVVGCGRGAGTVDVYVIGENGMSLSTDQMAQVQALLTEGRELNVDVRACEPDTIEVSLYIRLKIKPGYDFATVSEEVRQAVVSFIDNLGIGRDLKLSEVGEVIYHIRGVDDYHFLKEYGGDCPVTDFQIVSADNIILREG